MLQVNGIDLFTDSKPSTAARIITQATANRNTMDQAQPRTIDVVSGGARTAKPIQLPVSPMIETENFSQ